MHENRVRVLSYPPPHNRVSSPLGRGVLAAVAAWMVLSFSATHPVIYSFWNTSLSESCLALQQTSGAVKSAVGHLATAITRNDCSSTPLLTKISAEDVNELWDDISGFADSVPEVDSEDDITPDDND